MTNTSKAQIGKNLSPHSNQVSKADIYEAKLQVLDEVEKNVVGEDEDIKTVHIFFTCKTPAGEVCSKCKKQHDLAYDYAGGMANGRNQLKTQQRQALTKLREKYKKI